MEIKDEAKFYRTEKVRNQRPLPQTVNRDSFPQESVSEFYYLMNQCFQFILYELKLVVTCSPLATTRRDDIETKSFEISK